MQVVETLRPLALAQYEWPRGHCDSTSGPCALSSMIATSKSHSLPMLPTSIEEIEQPAYCLADSLDEAVLLGSS